MHICKSTAVAYHKIITDMPIVDYAVKLIKETDYRHLCSLFFWKYNITETCLTLRGRLKVLVRKWVVLTANFDIFIAELAH